MFLITAHPRSGTGFTWFSLDSAGVAVGNEHFEQGTGPQPDPANERPVLGVVSWRHVALMPDRFDTVLHQVRHPLKVLSSAQTLKASTFELFFRYIGRPSMMAPLQLVLKKWHWAGERQLGRWAMFTWLRWNELIETRVAVAKRFQIEHIAEEWPQICRLLQVDQRPFPDRIPTDHHSRKSRYRQLTTQDLFRLEPRLAEGIVAKAAAYGYDMG